MTAMPCSLARSVLPPDFFRMPKTVVLDLEGPIRKFQSETAECCESELCVDEILSEVLIFISQDWRADDGITALKKSILNCFENGRDDHKSIDAICVSNAAGRLGHSLLDQLRHFGLYGQDGVLHYELAKDWIDKTTPVLHRHVTGQTLKTG